MLASGGSDGKIYLWNIEKKSHFCILPCHEAAVTSIIFSPEGDKIISGSYDRHVNIWSREATVTIETEWSVRHLNISPDGTYLLLQQKRTYKIWDLKD
jgi:WD40 repeat protein